MGKEWTEQHSLKNEKLDGPIAKHARYFGEHFGDDSKGLHKLDEYEPKKMLDPQNWKPSNVLHHGIPGVPKPSLGDAAGVAKEAGKQALSDQPTREDKIATEYHDKLAEMAKSGGEGQPAWPTTERSG